MGCSSPTTQYRFEYRNANVIGGTESTTGTDCPPYSQGLEGRAFLEAQRKFQEYLEGQETDPCLPDCVIHTATPWIPVPDLPLQTKVKRIFFTVNCPTEEDPDRVCLYSFEMVFFYKILQRTVTCIPNLEGPNDFFLRPIALEGDCK